MKERSVVTSAGAPAAIGPYSQAVRAGGFLFVSGQIPLDPATGRIVEGGIGPQTERAIRSLQAILGTAGLGLESVVKTTVFMTDLGRFAEMNEVYGRFFAAAPPARSTVQVAALPRGADVEIEAVALDGPGRV